MEVRPQLARWNIFDLLDQRLIDGGQEMVIHRVFTEIKNPIALLYPFSFSSNSLSICIILQWRRQNSVLAKEGLWRWDTFGFGYIIVSFVQLV